MNSVIGPTQMAFMKGRQLVDNFIIAEEVIHSWKKGDRGGILVKLDFEKAYDCVDHSFLLKLLANMGCGQKWIDWISLCISGSKEDLTLLLLDISNKCVDKDHIRAGRAVNCSIWIPSMDSDLFFNVDGLARGSPGEANIRGVLRDATGKVFLLFFSYLGVTDSNPTEVHSILRAC
ncbi:hypothetical protein Ddye_019239 [Dipteronia dyeriana]|uniref:Reverse transcriptase domain-containing protein n=1 Tax=Dipteronia dyeriana TaxID=168575 RepID=A0AAD9TYI7_9ROSI|nr:hypothetical protein Ddye_019239 [Dipteronia dyeriana]